MKRMIVSHKVNELSMDMEKDREIGGEVEFIPDIEIKLQPGEPSQTKNGWCYYIYPSRLNHNLSNAIWNDLQVSVRGAQHFQNQTEALSYIVEDICDKYNIDVRVVDQYGAFVGDCFPGQDLGFENRGE